MGHSIAVRDLESLVSWRADWRSLRVVVLGLGVTGFSAADTLVELGADVLVVAADATPERIDLVGVIGAGLVLADDGALPPAVPAHRPELIIVSPGYRADHPTLAWAAGAGIPVWGDIELAWRLRDKSGVPARWIAVTGTNGKTTTVQLAAHLLRTGGLRAIAVGNVGTPVLDAVRDPAGYDVLVVELSSFQLHWMPRRGPGAISPAVSACLNLADDHLDWHGSREAYAEAKGTVYANTEIACIYNRADPATITMVERAEVVDGCRAIGFGLDSPGLSDLGMVGDLIVDRAFLDDRARSALELTTHGELRQAGLDTPHMVANVLAAAAAARALGVEPRAIRDAIASFRVDHHRTEVVATSGGVLWVDDSKATNPHAAAASLASFSRVVWIVGGLLKGTDLGPLVQANAARLLGAIVIGRDTEAVREAFARHAPAVRLYVVSSTDTDHIMPEAVHAAAGWAESGDTVLLAPAAASMDQFIDYADRGARFAAAVTDRIAHDGKDADDELDPTSALGTPGPGESGPHAPDADSGGPLG